MGGVSNVWLAFCRGIPMQFPLILQAACYRILKRVWTLLKQGMTDSWLKLKRKLLDRSNIQLHP